MALKKCKECGNDVSTKATSCPKCGAVLKKKTGCLGYAVAGIAILVLLSVIGSGLDQQTSDSGSSAGRSNSDSAKPTIAEEGETVGVGYTSYAVWRSWWSNQLSDNQYLNEPPNASYLFVELTVRNNDTKARMVPPFKLVDENGAEYEASSNGWAVEGSIGVLESLNPSVSKQGFVVFDVPRGRDYRLEISGGYWSSDEAFIKLDPDSER